MTRLTVTKQTSKLVAMKATIDIPDDLYRRVKAKTAEQGLKIRDVTIELFQMWLTNPATQEDTVEQDRLRTLLTNHVGSFDSGINDLGSHPKHLKGFGEDSLSRR
jgi:hypothetical protein